MTRPLYKIAEEIRANFRPMSPYAKPYFEAMQALDSIEDNYLCESGRSVVMYFLSNAGTWKGDVARRVKAELKGMLK